MRRIETTQKAIRMVAMSDTLLKYEDVARFLRVNLDDGLFVFDNSF